jgi:hypothetical protein
MAFIVPTLLPHNRKETEKYVHDGLEDLSLHRGLLHSFLAAVGKELLVDGFVLRYHTKTGVDGLPPGEGVFLPCSFWLADNYTLHNRDVEASTLFERLLSLCNDVGLLEYDPHARRQVGNFPQAFSHLALIGTALNLHDFDPAQLRGRGAKPSS